MSNRNPILHITKNDLTKIFNSLGIENNFIDSIFSMARDNKMQIKNMYIIQSSSKVKKSLEKTVEAENDYVEIFNSLLSSIRLSKNHIGAKPIRKDDRNYILLKEVAKMAKDFIDNNEIVQWREGFKFFIEEGLKAMGKKYALNKFKTYYQHINEKYESLVIIQNDNHPEASSIFYNIWKECMNKYANPILIQNSEEEYANFILGRIEADERGANYEQWIEAQFEQLAFLEAIPYLSQFYGVNAFKRYKTHITKVKPKKADEKREFSDKEQEDYFKLIRGKRGE